jgi:hypothetical protein
MVLMESKRINQLQACEISRTAHILVSRSQKCAGGFLKPGNLFCQILEQKALKLLTSPTTVEQQFLVSSFLYFTFFANTKGFYWGFHNTQYRSILGKFIFIFSIFRKY